jgi:hypothetical protein
MAQAKSLKVSLESRLGWGVDEYAALVGCSPAFIWGLIKKGKLGSVKIDGRRIIRRADGLALLQAESTTPKNKCA